MNILAGKQDDIQSLSAHEWSLLLKGYRTPNNIRAVFELLVTIALYAAFWAVMYAALQVSYLLSLLMLLPAAGMLMRLFMIQHDCGHGSFFGNTFANSWLGRFPGDPDLHTV